MAAVSNLPCDVVNILERFNDELLKRYRLNREGLENRNNRGCCRLNTETSHMDSH